MMILYRSRGSLAAAKQGHPPGGTKLSAHRAWILERISAHGEATLDELCVELAQRGVDVHRATVGRFLHRLGLSNKKSLKASEQCGPEIVKARDMWINRRKTVLQQALSRLIFIDETSTNTRLTKRTGWSPKGSRFAAYAPFGLWKTRTFIAGLRCHGLTAQWIVDAPMNSRIFDNWIETQLAPTLSKGDVIPSTTNI